MIKNYCYSDSFSHDLFCYLFNISNYFIININKKKIIFYLKKPLLFKLLSSKTFIKSEF